MTARDDLAALLSGTGQFSVTYKAVVASMVWGAWVGGWGW